MNAIKPPALRAMLAAVTLSAGLIPGRAADDSDAEIKTLREQIRLLDERLHQLEQKQQLKEQEAAAATKAAPRIIASDTGFAITSADGANSLKLRGLVQLDSRTFFADGGIVNNAFVLRRARLFFEGTIGRDFSFQLVPEFGGGSSTGSTVPSILDANLGVTLSKGLQFKIGKFKSPVGHELLQPETSTLFSERSLATNLVPNRDLGIQASGELLKGTVNYAVGVFNGVADGASSTNADFDNDKDVAGRVMASPFRNRVDSPVQGLHLGVSGSFGREKTASGHTSAYRTDGQQVFFSYAASTISDGQAWRLSPQVDYRYGSLGVLGEYVLSTVNVRPSLTGPKAELQNHAWQLAVGYVLTGEKSSYAGLVPATNFDYRQGTWGAFEVAARCANLKIDDAAFPLFASAASNADEATAFGGGLNWYLSKAAIFKFDYYHTSFGFNPAAPRVSTAPVLQQDEKVFITRFQLAF